MLLEAFNERLLRAIGVGVALADADSLSLRYRNPTFDEWFGGDAAGGDDTIPAVFDSLDIDAMRQALAGAGTYTAEASLQRKRRRLVIAVTFRLTQHEGGDIIVLECQNISRIREMETMIDSYARMVERKTRDLELEKARVEKLLLNLMPRSVYDEFKTFGVVTPQLYDPVSVLMLDFVGFTAAAAEMEPTVLVGELNDLFTAFDRIGEQLGCERIKTLGDAYIAVAGLPTPDPDHARSIANFAIRIRRYLERRNQSHPHKWQARLGLASGAVVGSVVGIQKYVYDVFGPAVNLAARLQARSEPMEITIHETMRGDLLDEFNIANGGTAEVRGFGEMRLFRLSDSRTSRSASADL